MLFRVTYKSSNLLDGFKCYDVKHTFYAHKVEFHGGIVYCYRTQYAYVAISEDDMVSIDDLNNPGAYIDISESFKAGELAYYLPF